MPVDHQLERQLAEANAVGFCVSTRPRSCRHRSALSFDGIRVRAAGTAPKLLPKLPTLVVRELDRIGESVGTEGHQCLDCFLIVAVHRIVEIPADARLQLRMRPEEILEQHRLIEVPHQQHVREAARRLFSGCRHLRSCFCNRRASMIGAAHRLRRALLCTALWYPGRLRIARRLPESVQELGAVFRLPPARVEVALDTAEAKPRLLSGGMHPPDQRGEVREAGFVEVHERDRVVLQHLRELRLRLDRHRHRHRPVARRDSGRHKCHRRTLRLKLLACATTVAGNAVPATLRHQVLPSLATGYRGRLRRARSTFLRPLPRRGLPPALRGCTTLRPRMVVSPSGFSRLFLSTRGRRRVLPLIDLIVLRMFSASHVKSPLHTSRVRSGEAHSAFRPERTHRHEPIPVRFLM